MNAMKSFIMIFVAVSALATVTVAAMYDKGVSPILPARSNLGPQLGRFVANARGV